MKNIVKCGLLVVVIQLFTFCSSDEKLNEQSTQEHGNFLDKTYIENASVNEQLKYKRYHLLKLTTWLSHNNKEVRSLIEATNRNTDKENFGFESIITEFKKRGNNLSLEKEKELMVSLEAFIDLGGENWYPYVRFDNKDNYLNRNPYDETKPLFALEDFENNNEIAIGYQENENGELERINETLTQSIGDEDDIIVIGIGTCPFAVEGEPCPYQTTVPDPPYGFALKIGDMKIKAHKEVYPFRSDISFTGYYEPALPLYSGDCGELMYRSVNCYNPDGSHIDQYKRSWIRDGDTRTQNFKMKTQVDYENDDIVFYVIFEHDSWPATERTAQFDFPNGQSRNVLYRSWQEKYDKSKVSMDPENTYGIPYGPNYYVNNNDIEYNLTYGVN